MIWLDLRRELKKLSVSDIQLTWTTVPLYSTVRELGVTIDRVSARSTACQSASYKLCQLWTVTQSLSDEAAKTLVWASVSCRLDYCNGLL